MLVSGHAVILLHAASCVMITSRAENVLDWLHCPVSAASEQSSHAVIWRVSKALSSRAVPDASCATSCQSGTCQLCSCVSCSMNPFFPACSTSCGHGMVKMTGVAGAPELHTSVPCPCMRPPCHCPSNSLPFDHLHTRSASAFSLHLLL